MPRVAPSPTPRPSRQRGPNLAATQGLRVIDGGRTARPTATILVSDLDGLHVDHVVARAERLTFTTRVRDLIRLAEGHMAAGHDAVAAMHLERLTRLNRREEARAIAMDDAKCPCGREGSGHGDADSAELAVPERSVA